MGHAAGLRMGIRSRDVSVPADETEEVLCLDNRWITRTLEIGNVHRRLGHAVNARPWLSLHIQPSPIEAGKIIPGNKLKYESICMHGPNSLIISKKDGMPDAIPHVQGVPP